MSEPILWEKTARENFEAILAKIPVFLREYRREKSVTKGRKERPKVKIVWKFPKKMWWMLFLWKHRLVSMGL